MIQHAIHTFDQEVTCTGYLKKAENLEDDSEARIIDLLMPEFKMICQLFVPERPLPRRRLPVEPRERLTWHSCLKNDVSEAIHLRSDLQHFPVLRGKRHSFVHDDRGRV